jgi:hypothetical protein
MIQSPIKHAISICNGCLFALTGASYILESEDFSVKITEEIAKIRAYRTIKALLR